MPKYKQKAGTKPTTVEAILRLLALQSPGVQESMDKLQKQYGEYAVSADEVRAMLDKALGDRTLTEELHKLRGK